MLEGSYCSASAGLESLMRMALISHKCLRDIPAKVENVWIFRREADLRARAHAYE